MSRSTTTTITCDDCKRAIDQHAHGWLSVMASGPSNDGGAAAYLSIDLCRACAARRGFAALLAEVGDKTATGLVPRRHHKDGGRCFDPLCQRAHTLAGFSPVGPMPEENEP